MITQRQQINEYSRILVLLIFFIFLIPANPATSQVGSPTIKNFDRQGYDGGTQNWHIRSSESGLIYFGNNKGLLEYDGTSWKTFNLPNFSIVRSFAFVGDSIMVGGQNEIGFFTPNEDSELRYHSLTSQLEEKDRGFDDIWKTFVIDNQIYFCSEKEIITFMNGETQVIKPETGRFENFFVVKGQLWIQTLSKGLFQLNNNELTFLDNSDIFENNRVVAILEGLAEDELWIITRDGLMYKYMDGIFNEWNTEASKFLKDGKPYCAIKLKQGNIAIGTSQNGLVVINDSGLPIQLLNSSNGLQNNTILSLYQDVHDNLWLGLDNGIDYVEIHSPFRIIGSEFGIRGTGYSSGFSSGKLYFGTNQGLFFIDWDRMTDPFTNLKFQLLKGSAGQVWNIDKIDDKILISKHEGAFMLDRSNLDQFSNVQGSWKFAKLQQNSQYLLQGAYDGLYIYVWEKGRPTLISKLEGFDESARIFEEDKKGRIWVSHAYKGLYSIELSDDFLSIDNIQHYDTSYGLPDNLFINVSKIRNEVLFTSTSGIYKYDDEARRFVEHKDFTEIFGSNRNIHRLLEDEEGNVWFSIDNEFGVMMIEEKGVFNDYEVYYYNQIQNSLVDGFEDIFALNEEFIFIGTESGFVQFNSQNISREKSDFSVLIRNVSLITERDSTVYFGYGSSDLKSTQNTFSYKQDDFRFSFSAPYFDKMDYTEYRYRLDGFELGWSGWSDKSFKEYTNLAEGKYKFIVQARNAYGELSEADIYEFEILPPWYWNVYVKIGYIFLSLLLFILIIRGVYVREAKKRYKLRADQEKQIQTKEEEFKKEFEKSESEIVQLKNDKLTADVNHKNSQLASATMHLVQKSELLISLKGDIKGLIKEAPPEFRKRLQHISRAIDEDIQLDNNWEQFEHYFDQVHENFFKRLRGKHPNLTPKDQKLCAYLRMNLATKEIAPLLNISVRGVEISRYRLRKKLDLEANINLVAHIMEI